MNSTNQPFCKKNKLTYTAMVFSGMMAISYFYAVASVQNYDVFSHLSFAVFATVFVTLFKKRKK